MYKYKGVAYDDYLLIEVLKSANAELRINSEQCLQMLNNLLLKGKGFVDALAIYEVKNEKVDTLVKKYESKCDRRVEIETARQLDKQRNITKNGQVKQFVKNIEDEQRGKDDLLVTIEKLNSDLEKQFNNGDVAGVEIVCAKLKSEKELQQNLFAIYDLRDNFLDKFKDYVEQKMISK